MDIACPEVHSADDKKKAEFRELIQVRHQGFDPRYLQHVKEFARQH